MLQDGIYVVEIIGREFGVIFVLIELSKKMWLLILMLFGVGEKMFCYIIVGGDIIGFFV